MRVTSLRLSNFRNYSQQQVEFSPGRNVILGENAQGKSNLLEAVELLSCGKSSRAGNDKELVRWQTSQAAIEAHFSSRGSDETLAMSWNLASSGKGLKQIKVNGVTQQSVKGLLGRLVIVSFTSNDLNLLRGSPRHRRDWLDDIAVRLRPVYHDTLSSSARAVAQRNKLLKSLAEKGKVTVGDQDELLVWDTQLAKFGAGIIKMRLNVLDELLPVAEEQQAHLSRRSEKLSALYAFRSRRQGADDDESDAEDAAASPVVSLEQLRGMEEAEIARILMKLMKERRGEEIRRKVSLVGPHRDDIEFTLNGASATAFASQGQQRSLVLAFKLAELTIVTNRINDEPVLLLDDVLAELDASRQSLLMSAVSNNMQTIITTTGLSVFHTDWLSSARVLEIKSGALDLSATLTS